MALNKKPDSPEKIEVFRPGFKSLKELDLFSYHIPAGFPSPAEDFLEKRLDLNDYLVRNQAATFLVKVSGNSMINAGISDGDILIVDRSLEPADGKIVLGVLQGEFTVKRIQKRGNKLFLVPENDKFRPIEITVEMDFQIWGIVTFSIHKT
ncbi:MAG: translesion error-prone DNA polymerase V autoproteolytic subunit [Bacteroidetes bacterium]|nr:translesion error-prone DNA polymerase V autoproteolytic subunit [Bacteroidota bacterium]